MLERTMKLYLYLSDRSAGRSVYLTAHHLTSMGIEIEFFPFPQLVALALYVRVFQELLTGCESSECLFCHFQ